MNKIAVVGAGVSGLMMTKLLEEKGYEVQVFEAQNRIGGRVKEGNFKDIPIDLGAQWLHQIANTPNVLTQILQEKNQILIPDSKDEAFISLGNGTYSDELPKIVQEFFDHLSTKDFMEDQSLATSIAAFSTDPLLKQFLEAFVSDMATSTQTLSTKVFLELSQTFVPEDFQLQGSTMHRFIKEYFSSSIKSIIHLNCPIVAINYSKTGVALQTLNEEIFEFDKCILSIPISQLQQNKILFSPPLPASKIVAFNKIGMGIGLKVILFFKEEILPQTYFNAVHAPYYVPVNYDNGKITAIITLLMGDFATAYYKDTAKAINNILEELAGFSGKDSKELLLEVITQDWTKEPYIEGTYSFALVGEENAREIAREPMDEVLYFIGEAMNTNHGNGFIHGAMETAVELSKKF